MSLQAQTQLPQEREPASLKEPVLWATIDHLRVPAGHYVRRSPQYRHRSPSMARRRPYFLLNDSPQKYFGRGKIKGLFREPVCNGAAASAVIRRRRSKGLSNVIHQHPYWSSRSSWMRSYSPPKLAKKVLVKYLFQDISHHA